MGDLIALWKVNAPQGSRMILVAIDAKDIISKHNTFRLIALIAAIVIVAVAAFAAKFGMTHTQSVPLRKLIQAVREIRHIGANRELKSTRRKMAISKNSLTNLATLFVCTWPPRQKFSAKRKNSSTLPWHDGLTDLPNRTCSSANFSARL